MSTPQSPSEINELIQTVKQLLARIEDSGLHPAFSAEKQQSEHASLRELISSGAALCDLLPDPVLITETEGTIVYANPAFPRMFGWSVQELNSHADAFVPEDQQRLTRSKMRETLRTGIQTRFETRRMTRDGQVLDILCDTDCIHGKDARIKGMVLLFVEIASFKHVEKHLRQNQKMEALSNMAAGIAHEFNNILMGIQGRSSLSLMEQDLSATTYEHLKEIEAYVYRASGLTQMLLSFSRGEKLDFQSTDLNEVVRSSVDMFGRARQEITVHTREQEGIWSVDVDRDHIEQILMNIFVNAWQAMPDGGDLYIETRNVRIKEHPALFSEIVPGPYVKISVIDTGLGMDEETLERVFEPFFTTRENIGAGLGLSSVFGIVKSHEGHIDISSTKEEGTTVEIYLPAKATGLKEPLDHERREIEETLTGTETILLVDNEKMIIDVSQKLLETLGYRVLTALGGKSALEIYERRQDDIDLVILDIIMPDMSGDEVYPVLKSMDPEVKVLISSGYSISGVATKLLNQGCNGFIQKPFNLKFLSHKVREVLDSPGTLS